MHCIHLFSSSGRTNQKAGTTAVPSEAGDRGMWQKDSSSLGRGAGWDCCLENGEAEAKGGDWSHEKEREDSAGSGKWHTFNFIFV